MMKGEARIRKNGDAIRSPAHTAAQSIAKIVLFRQDIVPSPFVEGLTLVVLNGIWTCGGRAEVTTVTKWRDFSHNPHESGVRGVLVKKGVAFLGAAQVPGRLRGLQGVGRNPRSGGDWLRNPR